MGSPVTIPNPAPGCSYLNYPRAVLNTPHPVYGGNLAGFGVGDLPTQFESGLPVFMAITANATSGLIDVAANAIELDATFSDLHTSCTITLFNNQVPAVQAFAHRGASDYSAATLGAENARTAAGKFAQKTGQAAEGVFNQAARSVEEVVQAARGTGAMKALGVGAAVAVGAGILFGSLRSPRKGQALAPSGNRFRPEEKIGVDGHVPGEPETGVMAPANPPRRIRPAQGGVRTAVVAPIGRTTELEVHMRADDRGRAAEASKIATRLAAPAGNSHVSITYRDTTRLDSLRTKERIREAMDER